MKFQCSVQSSIHESTLGQEGYSLGNLEIPSQILTIFECEVTYKFQFGRQNQIAVQSGIVGKNIVAYIFQIRR